MWSLRDWGKHPFQLCNAGNTALSVISYLQSCSNASCLQRLKKHVLEANSECSRNVPFNQFSTMVGNLKIKASRKETWENLNKFCRFLNCHQLSNVGEETSRLGEGEEFPLIHLLNEYL